MSYNEETGMYEGFIYEIYNNVNDAKYIGQTVRTVRDRFWQHKKDAKAHPDLTSLYRAMNKHGLQNFNFKVLEQYAYESLEELKDKLNEREIDLIKNYKEQNIRLYNMTKGGDNAGNTYPKKPILVYLLNCKFLYKCCSMSETARKLGVSQADVSKCCNRKLHRVDHYIFRYADEPLSETEIKEIHNRFPKVVQYTTDEIKQNEFLLISDAQKYCDENNIKADVKNCCLGRNRTAGGFIWRKEYDF